MSHTLETHYKIYNDENGASITVSPDKALSNCAIDQEVFGGS